MTPSPTQPSYGSTNASAAENSSSLSPRGQQRAALYWLVPDDAQAAAEAAARLEAFALANGYVVVARYADRMDDYRRRPKRQRLLARARTVAFDVLCVARFDELAHTRAEVARLVVSLGADGVVVVSAAGGRLDGREPATRFFAAEVERHRKRVRRAIVEKRARGERVGEIPYGHRLSADGVHLEPDPSEQAVISRVRMLAAQGHSLRSIARTVTSWGWYSRVGRPFGHVQIARMLARGRSPASST